MPVSGVSTQADIFDSRRLARDLEDSLLCSHALDNGLRIEGVLKVHASRYKVLKAFII
jgi:hypothetical protein